MRVILHFYSLPKGVLVADRALIISNNRLYQFSNPIILPNLERTEKRVS